MEQMPQVSDLCMAIKAAESRLAQLKSLPSGKGKEKNIEAAQRHLNSLKAQQRQKAVRDLLNENRTNG
jgi:hypothetical protein